MSKLEKLNKTTKLHEFAKLLGYKPKSLSYILYQIPEDKKYSKFQIPKRNGGTREISSPTDKLKKLQSRLATLLSDCYEEINSTQKNTKSIAHGFRKNHSIRTNAISHRNRRYVFNIDLEDFFPTFNFGRVRGFFIKNRHFDLDPKVATIIAQIACFNNELPQGSPCSPVITNLLGNILDIRLVNLAKKAKCTYSRYADDLTFSTNQKSFPESIALKVDDENWAPSDKLISTISKVGFKVNESKTSMQYKTSRQITTGLVVNKKVNVKRDYYNRARAYCHALFRNSEYFIENVTSKNPGSKLESSESKKKLKPIKGTISQLDGILSFIYHVKRPYDKDPFGTRRYKPVGITKLYRKFLFYKHFIVNAFPMIICEGKTDIIYLKCALINLQSEFNDLITKLDSKNSFKLQFLNFSANFKDVFAISEGSSGLEYLIDDFTNKIYDFKGLEKKQPVIIILDTDEGVKKIKSKLKIKDFKKPFVEISKHFYLVFISDKPDLEIEDLFDKKIRNTLVDGKKFNPKKPHGDETEYGKHIFAERVIKPNKDKIDFSGFKPIFEKIRLVMDIYINENEKYFGQYI